MPMAILLKVTLTALSLSERIRGRKKKRIKRKKKMKVIKKVKEYAGNILKIRRKTF